MKNIDWKGIMTHQYALFAMMIGYLVFNFPLSWDAVLSALYVVLGIVVGFVVLFWDKWVVRVFEEKRWVVFDLYEIFDERLDRGRQITRSWVFMLLIMVMVFFVKTSSTSLIMYGVVVGMLLHILYDLIVDRLVFEDLSHWQLGIRLLMNEKERDVFMLFLVSISIILVFVM